MSALPRLIQDKIREINPRLTELRERLASDNLKVVFTNGCFDLLHAGHVEYLEAARQLGDVLFVGVNDDASVRTLKGEKRPLVTLELRMKALAGLEAVDYVLPMAGTVNCSLMQHIQPHVWAKGGDYTIESLNSLEKDVALLLGVRVVLIPVATTISTTALAQKIKLQS